MPATDSFTSSAAAVSSAVAVAPSKVSGGNLVLTQVGNWGIVVDSRKGVTISKASSFGGTQSAPTWPVSLDDARALAAELIKAVT